MEAIGRDLLQPQCGDEFDDRIGIVVDVRAGFGKRFGLPETRRIRGNAGEMRAPALHQLFIFAARARALMDQQQHRTSARPAIMHTALARSAAQGQVVAGDRCGHGKLSGQIVLDKPIVRRQSLRKQGSHD